ncbi:MAG: 23S rRNA (uracil(1939)-C(5))-methyltransferase RlmD [Gordonibacter pamelaeae]|uniref:23S rRNA (Uracil(1939)-C(5))-methyltransferase RlmD n=3 Tax=Gordonibacter pamelaeae TaxID=471189 RepID=A0A369M6X3_9ACTN|nr:MULTISPECIES: 23S rRNA (uracil(1939)-C(5))-methyltransferase RlmD [Gordonibacter]HJH75368.1 23S rRNA (uracil(1939)-C(5))-methyltransferase RlmD [Eggerthellaceae bacterium]MBS4895543.1 23S rRNA (uracil(1939)-C(5))-methyltransferase RlmD [Gordonibacter pamelaeae]MCB6313481.1 23S rRNA (uracil(1939)-C(5))-methyltransferase RlmD [Gordonibacter pamelaeae]MCB6563203.1 23S rRNA (uracil(1939)-C(5))-methyltransferase RlmD [Gordonibacter urolithinfaciens]MCQ4848532.1 23S rRNA (uracil(1939)-C(5))-methy
MEETLRIERMGNGAEAVGRLASGKTVFVAGGAPGDAVRVEVVEEKASFARARIVAVEEPSPLRAEPRCPHGDACGGCPWQHLSYEAQLEAKRANVVGALVHTARLEAVRAEDLVRPCLPSKRQWGYRNKLELGAARAENGEFLLGFHREGTHEIATPAVCPLAHDAVAKAPKALRGALRFAQGSADLGIFRVGVRHSVRTRETEIALWTKPGAFPRAHVAKTLKSALKATSIVRVLADPGRARKIKGVETLDGKGCWGEELADARFLTSAPSFFQVNTAQAEKLAAEVVEGLGGRMGEEGPEGLDGLLVADLYAGGGTFSVPLARAGADVIAIEAAGSSVRDLRRNAEMNGVDIEVVGGDAARELPELGGLDALVVDPPRAGLADGVAESIAEAAPARVAYVSCNPATWARDVARFEQNGYRLARAQPVDLFPQTHHVEVASLFERE